LTPGIRAAADLLTSGKLVAFPTETVYGLGARADQSEAVAGIFAAKNRPSFDPLIVHVADLESAQKWAFFNAAALALAKEFWPGPLTLILPRREGISDLVTSGLETVGIRIPAHPLALELLRTVALPVAAPSANPFGYVSPTCAEHVRNGLGNRIDMVLDGGDCEVGVESTIISMVGVEPRLLRPGGLSLETIEAALGKALSYDGHEPAVAHPSAPGLLESHYAPGCQVLCFETRNALERKASELDGRCALLGQNLSDIPCIRCADLGETDLEMATGLFRALRDMDRPDIRTILALLPRPEGLGLAVRDRLIRAGGSILPQDR
jgi:L-threonylcarbamoyladenylate synthase